MKLSIEQSSENREVEIIVKCPYLDDELERLIAQIRLYSFTISGKKEGVSYILKPEDIFYFDSVDNKTFVYCEKEVYEARLTLTEIEEKMKNTAFMRVSKSSILNVAKLTKVKSYINGRLECYLNNGEKLIASRHYVQSLKAKLGL